MEMVQNAHKHGITDDNIHPLRNPIQIDEHDGYIFLIGTTPSGTLLELCINEEGQIFHAMKARPHKVRR